MNVHSFRAGAHALRAVVLLGCSLLIAPLLGAGFLPLSGDFLLDGALWFLLLAAGVAVQLTIGLAWWRRGGKVDVAVYDELAMQALSLVGGGFFGVMGLGYAVQRLGAGPFEKGTALLGAFGLIGVGASLWSAWTTVRYARELRSPR